MHDTLNYIALRKESDMKRTIVFISILFFIIVLKPLICCAETAEVLPKGIFYFDTTYYHYLDITKRFNHEGESEPLAIDLNTDLNSRVFPALSPLDPFVGGNASIGRSEVDFRLIIRSFEFSLYYGITDKLSIGILAPYEFLTNKVQARLDSSTANVGKNPFYNPNSPNPLLRSPLIPIAAGGIPLTTDDAQNLIGKGLDVNGDGIPDIQGFGFKRVGTWSDSGFDDIELLGKYQLYNKGVWRLASAAGVRLPTGQVDDPDNLVDLGFGNGNFDLLFRLYADYLGIKNVLLNTTIRYDIQLPDRELLRVPDFFHQPLTTNKEDVKRNLGDIIELEAMGNYYFTQQLFGGLKYRFTKKFKDSISGNKGFAYSSLEEQTDFTSHMFFINLGYSTVQMYLEKKFSVPFCVNLAYRNRFAGTNFINKSQYLSLDLTVFF